jgi:hypothetical protein
MLKRRVTLIFSLCELVIAHLGQVLKQNVHEDVGAAGFRFLETAKPFG